MMNHSRARRRELMQHHDFEIDDDWGADTLGRHAITLFAAPTCLLGHCCRVVMREKAVAYQVEHVTTRDTRVAEHNPYGETPTLLDRELPLYDVAVIIDYLDERFPHPPLMPIDPVSRAKARLMLSRVRRDWLLPLAQLAEAMPAKSNKPPKLPAKLKRNLRDGLVAVSPLVSGRRFFLGGDFSLVDAHLGPLLWRLEWLKIELPKQATSLAKYADMLFSRPAFTLSLSPEEEKMR